MGLLVAIGVVLLKSGGPREAPRPSDPDRVRGSSSNPPPLVKIDLEQRIRDEVRRALEPIEITVPLIDGDGHAVEQPSGRTRTEYAANDGGASDGSLDGSTSGSAIAFVVPRLWPELPLVRLQANGLATRLLRRVVLPAASSTLDPLRLSAGASLRGRAVTSSGDPAAHVNVALFEIDLDPLAVAAHPGELLLATAQTDGRGEFRLDHLMTRFVRVELGATEILANGVRTAVEIGGPGFEIEMETAAPPIEGRVVDGGGEPIRGACVAASMTGPDERSFDRATTDGSGRFALRSLAVDYYVVTATAPGFERVTIRSAHSGVSGLAITLRPLARATLELVGAPRDLAVPVVWRTLATTGVNRRPTRPPAIGWLRDGQLELRGITAGTHALELTVPGAMPIETAAVEFIAGTTTALGSYTLEPGASVVVRMRVPGGHAAAGRAALAAPHHSGIALERDLFLLPDHSERAAPAGGRFEWLALPPGPRVLALRAPGCADRAIAITVPTSGVVDLGELVLDAAGAVEGVVRRLSGVPLADAMVEAEWVGGAIREASTTPDGRFRFDRLLPGRWELRLLPSDDDLSFDLANAMSPPDPPHALLDVTAGTTTSHDFQLDH